MISMALGLASLGSAQLLQFNAGQNESQVLDLADTYDVFGDATNIFDYNHATSDMALGSQAALSSNPWSAIYPNGTVTSNGETSLAAGNFTNTALSATYTGFLAANADLTTSLTGPGSFYGVFGTSTAYSQSSLDFTATQPTTLTFGGSFGLGGPGTMVITLFDLHTFVDTYILNSGAGGFSVNYSQNLVTGDEYVLTESIDSNPDFQFDGAGTLDRTGGSGGSGSFNATFAPTPEPEPMSCGLLGLWVVALLQRRRKSA